MASRKQLCVPPVEHLGRYALSLRSSGRERYFDEIQDVESHQGYARFGEAYRHPEDC